MLLARQMREMRAPAPELPKRAGPQ